MEETGEKTEAASDGTFRETGIQATRPANGTIALVEYKGKHLADNPKQLHKRAVGELWARQSKSQGIFIWVADKDWTSLEQTLQAGGRA